ncbi:MAG: helix-turn-helix domain-containing protein [Ktedonobacteraceae bacterium]|nr:helix-turn-helix domain-containing protein [Ktedonobacteraceae bacterium]
MTTEYVNIMEAARRCGVSDKTIRRWIHAQKLRAQFPQPNQCKIAISDLEPFLPGHLPGQSEESLESRVATLECQVQALERQVQQLLSRPGASKEQRPAASRKRHATTGPLPRHLVSVLAFAELHRIPQQKVHTHIEINLLPVHKGTWTDHDEQEVMLAFDAKGRQAFHHLYHEMPLFVPCSRCPHTLPGHV